MAAEFLLLILIPLIITYFAVNWMIHRPRIGRYNEKHVFITGCDTGFGNLLAKRLDRLGFHVFAGCLTEAGRKELIHSSSTGNLKAVSLDVTKPESIQSAYEFVLENIPAGLGLWGLVNNAGIGNPLGPTEWHHKDHFQNVLAVNLFGVIEMTRIFFPLLFKSGKGRIVNTSSILGTFTTPGFAPYCVSKYGVEAYSDCLRRQLFRTDLKVCLIEPCAFVTHITSPEGELQGKAYMTEDDDTETSSGKSFLDKARLEKMTVRMSNNLELVIDAYEHALTARIPKSRYLVGELSNDKYAAMIIPYLPTWIADAIIPCAYFTSK